MCTQDMVLKKRLDLDYGFNGFRIPVIPRAPRSVRRRGSRNKSVKDGQICAFELLAAVAGKLLQESESSTSSNAAEGKDQLHIHNDGIKEERPEEGKPFGSGCFDQGSSIESVFIPEIAVQEHNLKSSAKDIPHANSKSIEGHSIYTSSNILKKVGCDVELDISHNKKEIENFPNKSEGGASNDGESCGGGMENGNKGQTEAVQKQTEDSTVANNCCLEESNGKCMNTHSLFSSDSSVQLSLYRDPVPSYSFHRNNVNVKVGNRDNDENSSRCNQPSTKRRALRPQSCIGYRRVRKLLTSKYWKVAPKLKDCEFSNIDGGMRFFYHKRKAIYRRERCQHEVPSKRRKLFEHASTVACDQEASGESISNSPDKGMKADKSSSAAILHRVTGVSSSSKGHQTCFQSKDSRVKFSIKSLRVPELYIEVPQIATVGSLKRTVMEAVTAILGGGLRVGVFLQGRKVRDDNRTLLQTGISNGCNLNTLGFKLEPSFTQASPSPKDPPLLLPCDAHEQLSSPALESGFSNASSGPPPAMNLDNHVEGNHELVPYPTNLRTDGIVPDSKALVTVPPRVEALAVVPINQKTKRPELSQRRTRRPFSVTEVEALVEAVEKLGTGRWRDVKIRAFDNANHRTYVDLKDKWKTLVHTASISPQQRRGEPVPQELLDRVLAAHAYWSQHQSKQHGKHHVEPLKISEAQVEGVGA